MSLILDALRKSEAERQRGKSPGLFATTPGMQRETFPRMKLWPVLVFLAFLIASAWVIWRGESRRAEGEQAVTAGAPSADAGIEALDSATETEGSTSTAGQPGLTVPATPSPPPAATDAAQPQATPSPAPPTVVATPPAPATELPALPTVPMPTPPAPDVSDDSPTESLPTVAVLDSDTRASLPPLKLSMHVFGQDPAKRFAIIDGKRVGAGSLLGNGVVEEIRRDGVVINVNGQRLLVPKP